MEQVSIIGTGELGAMTAFYLANSDWSGSVVLHDRGDRGQDGKALDLRQANSVIGSDTKLWGSQDLSETSDSRFIVVADPRPWSQKELWSELETIAPETVILFATADPIKMLSAACRHPALRRTIIGTSPAAQAASLRYHYGRAFGCPAADVSVSLVGAPEEEGCCVVLATVAGHPVEELLSPADLRAASCEASSISSRGPRTLAAVASRLVRDMSAGRNNLESCYVWDEGSYGARNLFFCAPSIIGPGGLVRIVELPLEPRHSVAVSRSIDYLENQASATDL